MRPRSFFVYVFLTIAIGYSPAYAESLTAHAHLQNIKVMYERIEDYQCRMHEFSVGGGRRAELIINYYFKKPQMIRVDILDGNRAFDPGSVGVYTGGNRVTGHRGGVMKEIILSVKKDSTLATSVRGETIDQSGMHTVIESFEFLLANGDVTITEKTSHIEFEFHPFDPSLNDGVSRDVVWIDRNTLLIIRKERYEKDVLVQRVIFKDYIINAGLPDELFDARFEISRLRETGIQLLSQELEGDSITR